MSRDGLPRAYLRMSPDIDQHPDPLAMLQAMCAAARQPDRGRFREARVLERAVGRTAYRGMVTRGDVVVAEPGPGVYLAGWDEWQEGDWTVSERMSRMRARRRNHTVTPVTVPSSPGSIEVTTDAGRTSSGVDTSSTGGGVGVPPNPPPSGGLRSNRTNPRAKAEAAADLERIADKAKRWRRNQRQMAYHRGAITEAQLAEMNRDDSALEAIPGYVQEVEYAR